MNLYLQDDSIISVSERHEIGCWMAAPIRAQFKEITDITVNIDPEDDAEVDPAGPSSLRPLRREVLKSLRTDWGQLVDNAQIRLHYLHLTEDVEVLTDRPLTGEVLKSKPSAGWFG